MGHNGAKPYANGTATYAPSEPFELPDLGPPVAAAEIGDQIASILGAAEVVADQVRAEADLEARKLVAGAGMEAERRIAELAAEAERARAEAEDYASDIRLAVDAYAVRCRREVQEEVAQLLTDAKDDAVAIREAAERRAADLETDTRQRIEAEERELRALQAQKALLVDQLKGLAAKLAELAD